MLYGDLHTDKVDVCHRDIAMNLAALRDLGVTHVLNASLGKSAYHVNTNHVMYRKRNISFLGIEATDFMNFDLSPFFQQAADFIEEGLKDGMYRQSWSDFLLEPNTSCELLSSVQFSPT